jgi:hypothetical protein
VGVNQVAVRATNHCLTGCGIGEVIGMVLATWWGWGSAASIALAIGLAFLFGYSLALIPLLRAGTALGAAVGIALVADTLSITTMEIVDNAILVIWPDALDAGLADALFWISLAIALVVAWGPTFLVNRALIARSKGHADADQAVRAQGRGSGIGVRIGSTCSRRCSNAGGRISASPRCSASSSTPKPGPSVAISKSTPLGSRK